MKSLKITLSLLFFLGLFSTVTFAAESYLPAEKCSSDVISVQSELNVIKENKIIKKKKLTLKERFLYKRFSKFVRKNNLTVSPPEDEVLLVILAILLPPLAVYMLEGLTDYFWIDLILTILGWLPGVIFALYLILR